jgi:hypothetical protein
VIAARFGRAPGAEWVEIGGRGSDRRHDAAASSTLHRRLAAAARGQDAAGATVDRIFLRQRPRAHRLRLNPREPALAGRFPHLVWPVDITETLGQMELFDRLIADNSRTQIVDLGYAPFEQFFGVLNEIGFVPEARRRLIEPIVLFVTDPAPATVSIYAELRHRLPGATFVPVHNELVSVMFEKEDFPATRSECSLIYIPRLSPIVRGVIDRPSFSFATYMTSQPGGPTEVHQWIAQIFTAFRDLELRLLHVRKREVPAAQRFLPRSRESFAVSFAAGVLIPPSYRVDG